MSTLLEVGITNALIASATAPIVFLLARRGRNPAMAHLLWLIILVKLLTPPLVSVEIARLFEGHESWQAVDGDSAEGASSESPPPSIVRGASTSPPPPQRLDAPQPAATGDAYAGIATRDDDPEVAAAAIVEARSHSQSVDWTPWLASTWVAGSAVLLGLCVTRIRRFHRLLSKTSLAPHPIQRVADSLRGRLKISSNVEMRIAAAAVPPVLWLAGRRKLIVLPAKLLGTLREPQLKTVIAHELAHLKRRDHLVRWMELAAHVLYWWLPTVWWVRRQLREAEEAACDAWVVAVLPQQRGEYGTALVHAVEILDGRDRPLPLVASGLGEGRRLIRRIERLADAAVPELGRPAMLVVIAAALTILPTSLNVFPAVAQDQTENAEGQSEQPRSTPEEATDDASTNDSSQPAATDPLGRRRRGGIDRGVGFLKDQQQEVGTWSDPIAFRGGITALCTLALLEAGVPPTDKAVSKALAWIRENDEPEKTYVVSLITRVYDRAGLPEDRGRIKRNADWLASTMVGDGQHKGSWGYQEGSHEGDNSNSHYAILGLDAAEASGVEVPEGVWRAGHDYWLRAQNGDGSWGYKPHVAGTGSMTASGICSLAIIWSRSGSLSPEAARNGSAALDRAYSWMSRNYSVTGNPLPEAGAVVHRWHYYYLAALTRAMRHARQAKLDDHEWRTDVTEYLLEEQQADGSWSGAGPLEDNPQLGTAFAVIALAARVEGEPANGAFEQQDADTQLQDPERLVLSILLRADTVRSGRFVYQVETRLGEKQLQTGNREFCLAGDRWLVRNISSNGWTTEYDGRLMEYREQIGRDESAHRTLILRMPHPSGPFRHHPYPPTYLGTLGHYKRTRTFLRDHADELRRLPDAMVNGVQCMVLEWRIEPEQHSAFGSWNDMLRAGGTLRLYCAPSLGYALPRIEKIDRFGTVQGSADSFEFKQLADGVFLPSRAEVVEGTHRTSYTLHEIEFVNDEVPTRHIVPAITGGTRVADVRPHEDDTVDDEGNRSVNIERHPFRQFTTGAAYPNGLPSKLLDEMDKGVVDEPSESPR